MRANLIPSRPRPLRFLNGKKPGFYTMADVLGLATASSASPKG